MNPDRSLSTSFWVITLLQTIGSVDMPGQGARKMPAPRAYVAIVLLWGTLGIVADTGRGRAAAVIGWVLVGTSMLTGPFGEKLIKLLNAATKQTVAASTPPSTTVQPSAPAGNQSNRHRA